MKKLFVYGVAAFVFAFSSSCLAAPVSPTGGAVKFLASASPGALSIRGSGDAPTGKLELTEAEGKMIVDGALKLKLDSFQTGIGLRDRHMKEKYLEAGKFPEATLTLAKQTLPKNGSAPFEGELELHGVKKKVSGTAELLDGGKAVKASFPVSLKDYAITAPSFAGISVADQVNVETELKLGVN